MVWLSKNVEELVAIARSPQAARSIDVVVVGSGYGGAVAALRFAQAGRQVHLLERGQEHVAGGFPNDLSQAGGHVRVESVAQSSVSVMGNEDALFDFRIGVRAGALVGNGLGGGSLINAAVGLQPCDAVFRQPPWPTAFQREDMSPWFDKARATLEVRTPAEHGSAAGASFDIRKTAKFQRLGQLAQAAQAARSGADSARNVTTRFEAAPLAIQIDGTPRSDLGPRANCTGCGDCVTGCNVDAKLSLTKTYLPAAFQAGAQMFTGISVLSVAHDPAGCPERPWVLRWVRTHERRLQHRLASGSVDGTAAEGWIHQLRARAVILAAGTFGSTEILMRSRELGLSVSSTALGVRVSGNGDDVSAAYNLRADANAVGQGSGLPSGTPPGPTISGIIRFEDAKDPLRNTLVEDGAAPGLTRAFFHELLTTLGAVAQLDRFKLDRRDGGDVLALKPQVLQRSLLLLGIGHDSASGRIRLDAASDRLHWEWTGVGTEPVAALHMSRLTGLQTLGAIHIRNPAAGVFPGAVGDLLTGPQLGGAMFTVHPLGGCRMADAVHSGVVNELGAVFTADGQLHPGLYVLDGSVIPTSLGVNPMLTITALAERACDRIIAADRASGLVAAGPIGPHRLKASATRPAHQSATEPGENGAILYEVLRGPVVLHDGIACMGRGPARAALQLRLPVPRWSGLFQDPLHLVTIGQDAAALADIPSQLVLEVPGQTACTLRVTKGTVTLFRPKADSWFARCKRFVRLAATHVIGRWLPDWRKSQEAGTKSPGSIWTKLVLSLKGLWHATEIRLFEYDLQLQAPDGARYALTASKRIDGAASSAALWDWLRARWRHGGWPPVERPSVWQQLAQLPMAVSRADTNGKPVGHAVLTGRLELDLIDVMRRLLPQLGPKHDFLGAMFASAGYPLLVLRYLLTARLLDFRAPDYRPGLPPVDPATLGRTDGAFELLEPGNLFLPIALRGGRTVTPDLPIRIDVRRGLGYPETEHIRIGLIRYRQPLVQWERTANGLERARSIVLLNGFAQSTRAFVAPELGPGCLASMLFDAGWDVWLLEYRVSPLLDASALTATMDDIAAFDIPAAVEHIVQALAAQHGRNADRIQISAYSHCVGSASLAMSILGGWLRLPFQPGQPDAHREAAEFSRLAAVSFSQFLPFVVGSQTAQQRLQLASLLQNVLGRDMIGFTAGTSEPDLVHALLDRVFASLHYPQDEQCPHERRDLRVLQPDSTTCKRMAGLLSRLFSHRQLLPETHERLDYYFGRTNLGVFMHGVKCVEYERLVNAEGQNTYTTDNRLQQRMTMPLLLQHGMDNVLFDKESLGRSHNQLMRAFGVDASSGRVQTQALPGYAHFDCTIGRHAPSEVFPRVVGFFNENHRAPAPWPDSYRVRTRARLPRTGPIVGWIRTLPNAAVQEETKSAQLRAVAVRVWIELDTSSIDEPVAMVTDVRYRCANADHRAVDAWGLTERHLALGDIAGAGNPGHVSGRGARTIHAVADVRVPHDAQDLCIRVFSVHRFIVPDRAGVSSVKVTPRYPPTWGTPMVQGEVGSGWDPLGLPGLQAGWHQTAPAAIGKGAALVAAAGQLPPVAPGTPVAQIAQIAPVVSAAVAAPPTGVIAGTPCNDVQWLFALEPEAADQLLDTLETSLAHRRSIAQRADPGTLSRLMRSERNLAECELRLGAAQLACDNDNWQFLAAGCRHPGITGFETRRSDRSLREIAGKAAPQANCMFMLGDQIYADARAGVLDTASVIERLLPRYRTAFGSPGFRSVASRLPLFMVPDDHEIEDAWSGEHAGAGAVAQVLHTNAHSLFGSFQRAHGPDREPRADSTNSYLLERPGCAFLVLDTRFDRRTRPWPALLKKSTWRWVAQTLAGLSDAHRARPLFIVSGSVFAPGLLAGQGRFPAGGIDNWQQFHPDRVRMLRLLMKHRMRHVVFLSSDYHCSAVARLKSTEPGSTWCAWAIVAPPLHAPMRFANSAPDDLLEKEQVMVPGYGQVDIDVKKSWSGEGWLQCEMQTLANGAGWNLQLRFHLRDLDNGTPACAPFDVRLC